MSSKHFLCFVFTICIFQSAMAGNLLGAPCKPDSSIRTFKALSIKCEKTDSINAIILQAIDIGAPTYNQGNYLGCYRIYEGASYKILYRYANSCIRVSQILSTALEKSYGNFTDSDKAWIMRVAFDEILGEPTRTK